MQTRTNETTNLNSLAFLLALGGVGVGVGLGIGGGTFMLFAASEHLKNTGMICAASGFSVAAISSSIYSIFACCKKTDAVTANVEMVTEKSNLL